MNDSERAAEVVVSGALRSADHYSVPTDEWPGIAISAHNAYLWEQADRPEVVEAVRKSLYAGSIIAADLGAKDRQARYTEATIEKVLTALIGPRPTEQEPHDE